MKKWIMRVMVVLVIGLFIFVNKLYYPPLPINNLSAKEALEKLHASSEHIVELSKNDRYVWYLTRMQQGQFQEHLQALMHKNNWVLQTQEGSGYFFERGEDTLIITTEMWTAKYVIIKVPIHFDS